MIESVIAGEDQKGEGVVGRRRQEWVKTPNHDGFTVKCSISVLKTKTYIFFFCILLKFQPFPKQVKDPNHGLVIQRNKQKLITNKDEKPSLYEFL